MSDTMCRRSGQGAALHSLPAQPGTVPARVTQSLEPTEGALPTMRRLRRASLQDPSASLVAELRAALAPERVRTDGAQRSLMARDASTTEPGAVGPVCLVDSTAEVQAVLRIARAHGRAVVPRGAGTGLTGGAVPLGGAIVLSTARMNRILSVDLEERVAWVEPGTVNLDLTQHLRPFGFHFAPDPSSQQVCTIGGNVANNAGGPHCLAEGVTNQHVLGVEVVLPDGEIVMLGGEEGFSRGYDLRGVFVGSEGTMGIATRIAVAITPNAPAVRTLLLAFPTVESAARAVSAIIAAGIIPSALELLDQLCINAVEDYISAGYPRDAAAALLAEVEGLPDGVLIDAERISDIGLANGATSVRLAADAEERALLWKGRKTAFGALARIASRYYLHDTVIPRARLAETLDTVGRIAEEHGLKVMNVFHAGDGNLHPLLLFDGDDQATLDRVHAAGAAIIRASLAVGGSLSGEHGIGVEKQGFMAEMFTHDDLDHQERIRRTFDPDCLANPGKVLPVGHSCADIQALHAVPAGVWG
jgi:glycolate oxidase